jgi:uncharacterized CHY-type Zn-finger protein
MSLRCSKCKEKFEEGELNSVVVRDRKSGKVIKDICGACASKNRPKFAKDYRNKYGFKRVNPWCACPDEL